VRLPNGQRALEERYTFAQRLFVFWAYWELAAFVYQACRLKPVLSKSLRKRLSIVRGTEGRAVTRSSMLCAAVVLLIASCLLAYISKHSWFKKGSKACGVGLIVLMVTGFIVLIESEGVSDR